MSRGRNPRLKRSNIETEYTEEMIREIAKCAADPIYFIENYVYIKHPVKGRVKFNLYEYQKEMIRIYQSERFAISCLPRQSGKTETTSAYFLWFAIFHEDKTILIASNKSDNAKEIISKVSYAYEELPDWLKPGIDESDWNKFSIKFETRSRIMATTTSADTGRGLSISILYCDEFAFVPLEIQQSFYTSIYPVISTGGKMFITSTPNGDIDLFAQLWRGALSGTNGYRSLSIKWSDVPGRDETFKEQTIAAFDIKRWLQEYECEFISSDRTLIDSMILQQIEAENEKLGVEPVFEINGQVFWKRIQKNSTYVVGVDVSEGLGEDYSVIEVFEFPSMVQVSEYRTNETSPVNLYGDIKNLLRYLDIYGGEIYWSLENNGIGQSIIALYEADENPPEAYFVSESGKDKKGFFTSGKSKPKSCLMLKEMVMSRSIKIASPTLLSELKSFVRRGGSYGAQKGATDDCVAATLIVLRIVEEMAAYDDGAYHKLYTTGLEKIEETSAEFWDEHDESTNDEEDDALPFIVI